MANTLSSWLTSLTYGGHELLAADLSIHLDIVSGMWDGLEVRGKDTVVPGDTGQIPRTRRGHQRSIVLAGFVQGVTGTGEAALRADFMATMDNIKAWFGPADDPPPDLVATTRHSPAETWTIGARTLPGMVIVQRAPSFAEVSVSLLSVDPNWVVT